MDSQGTKFMAAMGRVASRIQSSMPSATTISQSVSGTISLVRHVPVVGGSVHASLNIAKMITKHAANEAMEETNLAGEHTYKQGEGEVSLSVPGELYILVAHYGSNYGTDVTAAARALVVQQGGSSLRGASPNALFGDPEYGIKKRLRIVYTITPFLTASMEARTHEQGDGALELIAPANCRLLISSAHYGSAYQTDVTATARTAVEAQGGNRLVGLPSALFGDPQPGMLKRLRIMYTMPERWAVIQGQPVTSVPATSSGGVAGDAVPVRGVVVAPGLASTTTTFESDGEDMVRVETREQGDGSIEITCGSGQELDIVSAYYGASLQFDGTAAARANVASRRGVQLLAPSIDALFGSSTGVTDKRVRILFTRRAVNVAPAVPAVYSASTAVPAMRVPPPVRTVAPIASSISQNDAPPPYSTL